MKTAFLLRMLTVALVAIGAGQSCSSKDETAQEEAVAPDTEQNAAEGEEGAAAEGADTAATEQGEEGNAAAENAESNEASAETAEGGEAPENAESADATAESQAAADVMATDDTAGAEMASAEAMPAEAGVEGAAVDSSGDVASAGVETQIMTPEATESAPMPETSAVDAGSGEANMGDGAVKYVKASSVKVHQSPDASSSVMKTMWKGDHILVSVEGNWAKLSSGGYVDMQGLSNRGVGRPRGAGNWR